MVKKLKNLLKGGFDLTKWMIGNMLTLRFCVWKLLSVLQSQSQSCYVKRASLAFYGSVFLKDIQRRGIPPPAPFITPPVEHVCPPLKFSYDSVNFCCI